MSTVRSSSWWPAVTGGQFEEVANRRCSDHGVHAGAGDGGGYPLRARRRRGGAGVLGRQCPMGRFRTVREAATITFTNQNDAPALGSNALTITEGQAVVLSGERTCRRRMSTTSTRHAGVHGIRSHGRAVRRGGRTLGVAITTFTQAQVTAERYPIRARRWRDRAGVLGDSIRRISLGRSRKQRRSHSRIRTTRRHSGTTR